MSEYENTEQTMEGWLHDDATMADLRPLARAWLVEQRKAQLVEYKDPAQQIRIEALRAAAAIVRDADKGLPDRTVEAAKKFAAYLESGD